MADQYCCINIIRGHSRKISVRDSEQIERERERKEYFEHQRVYPKHVYPQSQYITLERAEQTAEGISLSFFLSLSLLVSL